MNTYLGRLCSLAFVVLVLSACGGGGGGSGNSAGGTPSVKTKPTTITVIDGYIKGAIVYVDKNDNGDCDPDETQGTTDENGKVTLNIPEANVGKYPIVADVPADAIDSDTGKKVGTAFTLIAPKEHSGVVSPFTTLVVQKLNANKNLSFSDAQLLVAKSNGFELSVISSDFMSNPTARTLARTLVALQKDRLIELDKVSSCKAAYKNDVIQAALNDSMSSIIKIKACSTADEQKNGVACAESINSKAANFVKDTDSLSTKNLLQSLASNKCSADLLPTSTITDASSNSTVIISGGRTDSLRPTLSGSYSAALGNDYSVHVLDGSTDLGATSKDDNNKTWTFTPATDLSPGSHSFTAVVVRNSDSIEGSASSPYRQVLVRLSDSDTDMADSKAAVSQAFPGGYSNTSFQLTNAYKTSGPKNIIVEYKDASGNSLDIDSVSLTVNPAVPIAQTAKVTGLAGDLSVSAITGKFTLNGTLSAPIGQFYSVKVEWSTYRQMAISMAMTGTTRLPDL